MSDVEVNVNTILDDEAQKLKLQFDPNTIEH